LARKQSQKSILLVALGGNALIRKGQQGSIDQQFANLKVPVRQIARLSQTYRVIITHGNGPQVGNLLLQQEACSQVPRLPLEILVAQTEGQIGYMIESSLDEALMALGIDYRPLVSLITYVAVDPKDPAFEKPSKPIGPVYPEASLETLPYLTMKTAKGFRRVVASPQPLTIIEKREIRQLIDLDFIVICCGGGGIPVIRKGRRFSGVDAVIDKDMASAKLAEEVGVDIFMIATDEKGVALDYGTDKQRFLQKVTCKEMLRHLHAGQFPPGTMGPKVSSAVQFIRQTGKQAFITSINQIEATIQGHAGTEIIRDED
jgi:carbamate kinase